jgi:hypothetical protein
LIRFTTLSGLSLAAGFCKTFVWSFCETFVWSFCETFVWSFTFQVIDYSISLKYLTTSLFSMLLFRFGLAPHAKAFFGLPKPTKACQSLLWPTKAYQSLLKPAKAFFGLPQPTKAYQSLLWPTKAICLNAPRTECGRRRLWRIFPSPCAHEFPALASDRRSPCSGRATSSPSRGAPRRIRSS